MKSSADDSIVNVERMEEGLLITFSDGKCAMYTTDLLRRNLINAKMVMTFEDDLPEDTQ